MENYSPNRFSQRRSTVYDQNESTSPNRFNYRRNTVDEINKDNFSNLSEVEAYANSKDREYQRDTM
jgi:hypothetical protein